jgi:hypothetical protein
MLNGAGGECGDGDGVGSALARSDGGTVRLDCATWEDRMGPVRVHRRAKEVEEDGLNWQTIIRRCLAVQIWIAGRSSK